MVVGVVDEITSEESSPLTPMMRQYREAKERHPDSILLFRMGDFYEMFYDDAQRASKILDIALTTRDKNKPDKIPMCGFPHHASSGYISRLLAAGERVAICDQVEDPRDAKGIVRREITRVLTPGLTEEPGTLKVDENHFLVAISFSRKATALASFELSTGDFRATETADLELAAQELRRLEPKEVIIAQSMVSNPASEGLFDDSMNVHAVDDWICDPDNCRELLRELYGVQSLDGFGFDDDSQRTIAAGMVLGYLKQTRPEQPSHIKTIRSYHLGNYMVLDQATIRNLEIFRNIKDGSTDGTLVQLLGRAVTPMGARLLRQWLSYPLLDMTEIRLRLEVVDSLSRDSTLRDDIIGCLKEMGDLERIAGKIALKNVTPRDLVQLKESARNLPALIEAARKLDTELGERLGSMDDLSYVAFAIDAVIVDSPPLNFREGGIIKDGYHEELDELRNIRRSGKEWITRVELAERQKTGIQSLKVGYNKVFGYYIEVTKAHQDKIPVHYIRKQTLVNAERYVTEDLKEYELKILSAHDKIIALENEIFNLLRVRLLEVIPRIQETAHSVACLDVLVALADIGAKKNYVRPMLHEGQRIEIVEGRHPVLEDSTRLETFVPNDTTLDVESQQILIITGPNMAGKSTYMRQVALIVLMAQIGSFVPASQASIGMVDRIFTRIGAADYLAFGQSTFMVEMSETAQILHNATKRSLILLDEIGRGTSTFDGLSIAWAVTEFIHDMPGGGPRTLFATHYHELVDVAHVKPRVKNFTIAVREWKDRIIFLRKIVPGGTSRSYGIQVARLAGIPDEVVERAKEILSSLEKKEIETSGLPPFARNRDSRKTRVLEPFQAELFRNGAPDLLKDLEGLEIDRVTPLAALNVLAEWKEKYTSPCKNKKKL